MVGINILVNDLYIMKKIQFIQILKIYDLSLKPIKEIPGNKLEKN